MATNITTSDAPDPRAAELANATTSHRQGNFVISTRKLPISKAGPIEAMEKDLGIPVPEMIFGDNVMAVEHAPSRWRLEFNARNALDGVDKTGEQMLQVAHASSWSASREQTSAGIKEVVKPFDWSYTTTYKGTVIVSGGGAGEGQHNHERGPNWTGQFQPDDTPIPIELLKRRDPILFNDEVVLYESELDDNGASVMTVKVRVHAQRMLLLCRLFMRLDNVVVRVRDTRVYVDFDSETVLREVTWKEGRFEDVKQRLLGRGIRPEGFAAALRDSSQVAEILPTVNMWKDSVMLMP
ncbi:Uu.00g058820.m01.CDS01 [Anthostomella pinea]|uniref:Uu.00g058820.m01.CDS01 n=1 Tax=Anthostomella pinea TaxID=933095 RepID=A0AAI8VRY8_9PEZI|nr:Uu.00g058820.m01.CDS01 [Anthostomella pinea]